MVKIELNNWLKAEFLERLVEMQAVIVGEGIWKTAQETGFKKDMQQIPVEFKVDGKSVFKDWMMNFTSLKNLVNAYGDETRDWVGKRVRFSIVDVNVKGEIKKSVVGQGV